MDNLTISPVDNLRPCDNDMNPPGLAHGHLAAPDVAINIEGPNHLPQSTTSPAQDTTASIQDTISSLGPPYTVDKVDEVCKLMLHQQVNVDDQQQDGCKLNIKMEIRFRRDVSPELVVELISNMKLTSTCVIDLPTHVHKIYAHKPYVWSIDVQHCENPARSLKISRYSISGDGKRVATLSATDDTLFLDLWDISALEGSAPHSPKKSAEIRLKCPDGRTHTDPHASIAVSWDASYIALFPIAKESWVEQLAFYDGKRSDKLDKLDKLERTLDSHSRKYLPEFKGEAKFHITNTNNPDPSNELFITCDGNSVNIYKAYGLWSHIFDFPVQAPEPQRESFARKLIDGLQGKFFLSFSEINSDLQPLIWDIGRHSLLMTVTEPINSAESPVFATFSTDQSILAILQDGSIRTYWTGSKTPIGKWTVPDNIQVSRLTFARNDTQLLVECTDSTKQERVGYILDPVKTRTILLDKDPIAKVLGPGEYMPEIQSSGGNKEGKNNTGPQSLYSCHNSKLDFIQLDNIIYDPDNLNTQQCGQQMCNDASTIPVTSEAFKSESGLGFSYKFNPSEIIREFKISKDKDASSSKSGDTSMLYRISTFSLEISDGSRQKSFKIPTVTFVARSEGHAVIPSTGSKESIATAILCADSIGTAVAPIAASKDPIVLFLRQKMLLILCPNVIVTVWRLPEKYDDECTLLTAHWIEDKRISSNTTTKSVDIKQCEYHQHLFIQDSEDVEYSGVNLRGPSHDSHEHGFRLTVEGLVMMYMVAGKRCRKPIVQYLIENINRYQNSGHGCVILWIVNRLSEISEKECHELIGELLTSVLRSENSRWIPRPDFRQMYQHQSSLRFIYKLLGSPEQHKELEFMELVKITTQYCFEIAREHKDDVLTSPITAFLPILWRHRHREVALDLLRKLAYIPMNDGTQFSRVPAINMVNMLGYIYHEFKQGISEIEYEWSTLSGVIASVIIMLFVLLLFALTPLGFLIILVFILTVVLNLEKPQPVYNFQHPVVIDYFDLSVDKYYLARFDMLWMSRDLSSTKSITGHVDKMTYSWLLAPLYVIWYSFMPSPPSIERHELNLDAFDNPAIEALIEYKWLVSGPEIHDSKTSACPILDVTD
ncbi:hypothetical protein BGX21_003316 [Mortierella sp. AD011]|nr:hypothetical protein BGX21_003316 [Mortierella sp. AD011]